MTKETRAEPVPALTDERLTLVGMLLEVHDGLVRAMARTHSAHGLLSKEFDTLLRLARSDQRSLTMRDLAAQTATSTSGTTGLVDRLEGRGLVTRTQSSVDRRSFDITLTDAGHQLVIDDITALLPVIDRFVVDPVGADAPVVQEALERIREVTAPEATRDRRALP